MLAIATRSQGAVTGERRPASSGSTRRAYRGEAAGGVAGR
jgi:hypothetical protein